MGRFGTLLRGPPAKRDIPYENTTCHFDENYLLTKRIPGGVLAFFVNPAVRSFFIVYGEIIPRRTADVEIALSIFAEIDNKAEAVHIGERSRWEGAGVATVRTL